MRFDDLIAHVGDDRVLQVDDDSVDTYGALAGGLAVLLADVIEVGWFSVRHWGGVTLAIEFAGEVQEHPLPTDAGLDVRAAALPFARASRLSSARLVVVRTGEGTAVVRFDGASAIELAMDLPVRCPTCKATFDARRLWAEEDAKCAMCGSDLAVPDVLAAFVDDVMPGDGTQLEAFPNRVRRAAEPHADEPTDEQALERTLADAIDLLGPSDDDAPTRAGDMLTPDMRKMLVELGVPVPADDAPRGAIERALAEARLALVRFDEVSRERPSVDALVEAVGTIDPDQLIDEEPTDPSIYLDELPPHKDGERG